MSLMYWQMELYDLHRKFPGDLKWFFHLQNQILFLIIPNISSSLAKQQIRGTKQKQNSIDRIEQGIKVS